LAFAEAHATLAGDMLRPHMSSAIVSLV